jgi:hypothetical protein
MRDRYVNALTILCSAISVNPGRMTGCALMTCATRRRLSRPPSAGEDVRFLNDCRSAMAVLMTSSSGQLAMPWETAVGLPLDHSQWAAW